MIKKIVIIGPESTGKSMLSMQLAQHFNTAYLPEYAREYLEKKGPGYDYDDLYKIAEGQLMAEDMLINKSINEKQSNSPGAYPVFFDTDLYVIKIWSEFVFNKCDNRILARIALRQYDLYLLCNTDLPWTYDRLREHPDYATRQKLFHYYKEALSNQSVAWTEISGSFEERFKMAADAVLGLL